MDGTERTDHALRAAVEHADQGGAGFVVVNVEPWSTYRTTWDELALVSRAAREDFEYTIGQAETGAKLAAERLARPVVGDRDVAWTAVGAVGNPADVVLAVAADYDCFDILITETKPRWFGLRPGLDRTLAKRFDGTVTAVPEPTVEGPDPALPAPEPEI